MLKVLIIGSNGLIGNNLSKFLNTKKKIYLICGLKSKKKKFSKNINFFYYGNLNYKKNLTLLKKKISLFKPHFIINCCGMTKHVNNKKNLLINFDMPIYIMKLSKLFKFKFIHLSTDCIFDGKIGNYKENSSPNATDNYGLTKAKAENILKKSNSVIILRTSTIGHEISLKRGLLEWFLSSKSYVNGFTEAYFTGPTALELGKIIYRQILIKKSIKKGLFNVSSHKISKFLLLNKLKKMYKKRIKLIPDNKLKIDRSLSSEKFINFTNYKVKSWNQMIYEMKKFNDEYI